MQQGYCRIDSIRAVLGAGPGSVRRVFAEKAPGSKQSHVWKAIAVSNGVSTNKKKPRDRNEIELAESESINLVVHRLLETGKI